MMRSFFLPLAFLVFASVAFGETIRVLAIDSKPYFYRENDAPAGLEYEILRYFAEAQEQEIEVTWVDAFGELIPMIERGEGDIASGTMTVTSERLQRVDFTESYFPVRVMLVERDGEAVEDVAALSGSRLATIKDTTYEKLLSAIPGVELVYAANQRNMFEMVASGEVRALATDSSAFWLLEEFGSLKPGLALTEEQQYGFAVAKGSPLGKALSAHIKRLKASGIYFRLLESHLGAKAVEIVKTGKQH